MREFEEWERVVECRSEKVISVNLLSAICVKLNYLVIGFSNIRGSICRFSGKKMWIEGMRTGFGSKLCLTCVYVCVWEVVWTMSEKKIAWT